MLSRKFTAAGYDKTDFQQPADIYVINTCSVTENADKEFRKLVNRAKRQSPDARIAVIGCYAQLRPEQIAANGQVDLVLGMREKFNLLDHLEFTRNTEQTTVIQDTQVEELHGCIPSFSLGDRTRSFLKIQDGCDYPCTYCTIPMARGRSRSLDIDLVLEQAAEIGQAGVKEIVLTGVNVGDFKTAKGEGLIDLLQALEGIDSAKRIRISSIEPNLLSDKIIQLVHDSEILLPHFHIPLQSGSDTILAAMQRRYMSSLYEQRIAAVRESMPLAGIGADVIVGFPGETSTDFEETYAFIERQDISYLHVFTYSERPNTPAEKMMPSVPRSQRKARNKALTELSLRKQAAFALRQLNTRRSVLFETQDEEGISGMTDNYMRITVRGQYPERLNCIHEVELTAYRDGQLYGEF